MPRHGANGLLQHLDCLQFLRHLVQQVAPGHAELPYVHPRQLDTRSQKLTRNQGYPVILTTYHQLFAAIATQLLAHFTTLLDGRKSIKMSGRVYMRAVVPIGLFFSLSLICGNLTYLYLSVAFIQMLKATTPVAVLICGWMLGVSKPNLRQFLNVSTIVVGVVIASVGELEFVLVGVLYQIAGLIFEALRLTMVQRLLSSADFKMDPLVSVYYFAPVCALMNGVVALIWEVPHVTMAEVYHVGFFTFFLNGCCAFMLNVSVVILVCGHSCVRLVSTTNSACRLARRPLLS